MGLARRMAFTAIKMVAVKAGAFCQHGLERPLGAELAIVAAGRSGTNPHRWSRTTDRHSPVLMQAAIQGCLVTRGRALDRGGTTAGQLHQPRELPALVATGVVPAVDVRHHVLTEAV